MVCGIYSITNTVNGKCYYGSSLSVWARKRQHVHSLRKGTHRNRHLQSAWNLYGESSFVFALAEEVTAENLQAVEQSYLDNNRDGYNIAKSAECAPRGLKWSNESKKRMSEARKGRRLSEECKRKLSLAGRGRKNSPATRAKLSEANRGKRHSDTTKAKLSSAIQSQWNNDDYRRKTIEAQRAAHRPTLSTAIAARWADPQQRDLLSAERKSRWANPEYRAKMLEKRKIQGQKLRERNLQKKEK